MDRFFGVNLAAIDGIDSLLNRISKPFEFFGLSLHQEANAVAYHFARMGVFARSNLGVDIGFELRRKRDVFCPHIAILDPLAFFAKTPGPSGCRDARSYA